MVNNLGALSDILYANARPEDVQTKGCKFALESLPKRGSNFEGEN